MIQVRPAEERDATEICKIFHASYGDHYAHRQFSAEDSLRRLIFDETTLILVAEDTETGRLLGTASIIFDIGAYGDLVGEFGRLVVHPDGRSRGIGTLLMEERIARLEGRLHLALVENRAVHPFSQKISARHGFHAMGLLPQKMLFAERESVALYGRHFDDALVLRRNHPRVIAEAFPLAEIVLESVGLEPDVIADDSSGVYPPHYGFELDDLRTRGYASLLRFERGRVAHREVFGPVQLHSGFFKLRASHSHYLLALRDGRICGAVGFTHDEREHSATVFEIVSTDEQPIRFLLESLERRLREDLETDYVEIDVSAHAPRLQRTLLELGFLPVAYLPALAFQGSERLDAVRMARLNVPLDVAGIRLHETTVPVAEAVLRNFTVKETTPRIAESLPGMSAFRGLSGEQARRLASEFELRGVEAGTDLFRAGESPDGAYLILEGRVEIHGGEGEVLAELGPGACLGETSLVDDAGHRVSARAVAAGEAAFVSRENFEGCVRRRPDIGVVVLGNLARMLGEKLRESDER